MGNKKTLQMEWPEEIFKKVKVINASIETETEYIIVVVDKEEDIRNPTIKQVIEIQPHIKSVNTKRYIFLVCTTNGMNLNTEDNKEEVIMSINKVKRILNTKGRKKVTIVSTRGDLERTIRKICEAAFRQDKYMDVNAYAKPWRKLRKTDNKRTQGPGTRRPKCLETG